jgi:hypothetical protein
LYYQLAVKMPSTAETESGSLQSGMLGTPRATEAVRSDKFREGRTPTPEEYVQQHPVSLGQMWPTPRATDFKGAGPGTNDQSIQKRLDNGTKNLSESVQAVERGMWPTPSTRDHKGGYQGGRIRNGKISMDTLDVAVQATSNQEKTQASLNPDWVSLLMGYPKGWTCLDDGETDPGKTESLE